MFNHYPVPDDTSAVPTTAIPMTRLLNGYKAPTAFYEAVMLAAKKGVKRAVSGNLYTSRMLCGEEFWLLLTKPKKWLAGRCIALMVANRVFDLQFVQYKRSPTKRYRLN